MPRGAVRLSVEPGTDGAKMDLVIENKTPGQIAQFNNVKLGEYYEFRYDKIYHYGAAIISEIVSADICVIAEFIGHIDVKKHGGSYNYIAIMREDVLIYLECDLSASAFAEYVPFDNVMCRYTDNLRFISCTRINSADIL